MGIFEPFRALGYITSGVPFSIHRLGTETFVTVSVGKSWQVYNCAKLNLVQAGPQLPKKIRALASYREYTFAAYGKDIGVFKRAHQVASWSRHSAKVNLLLLFGDHIISVDSDRNMFMWAFKGIENNLDPVGHILLDDKFTPSCIMHPDTYLNKILIGSQEGSLQLWNISTKKKIYDFKGLTSSICSCVSSPDFRVIAVGCADGTIHFHNILYSGEFMHSARGAVGSADGMIHVHNSRYDFTFTHSRGAVTALSFCTDGQPLLASGDSFGVISIWNFKERRLLKLLREAHDGSIISLHFFANEPVLMSSSVDNSIKMWIFDTSDGEPRLLRFRKGHSAPPLCIRFYANGRHILSAGQDRAFRLFSVVQDQQSRELSQRHVAKRAKKLKMKEEEIKLKPVICFDCAEIRERDWCNVVTCHKDTAQAYVWRLQNFVLGEHILKPRPDNPTPVTACCISACGNFAILGTSGGWVELFNLQSGLSRGSYVDMSEKKTYAHVGEVVGVASDSTNTLMISVGYHGDIKVWDFKDRELKSLWNVGSSIVKIAYHRFNGILATVSNDMVIRLFDVIAVRMVRKFEGHTDRITDLCFSEDGKWILSSSMDGTLRIWDVKLASQIDAIQVDVPITALSLSPNMDVLATTHVDQNGICLWVNQAMFSGCSGVESFASGQKTVNASLPSVLSLNGHLHDGSNNSLEKLSESIDLSTQAFCKNISGLITLSHLPKSQWQSLVNLDMIKLRNKPTEPPKKPGKAPFFLNSVASLGGEIVFKPNEACKDETSAQTDEIKNNQRSFELPPSRFVQLLQSSAESRNFAEFTDFIKGLTPSSMDMELRLLQIIDDEAQQEPESRPEMALIECLLDYFIQELSSKNNFEFIQAVIRLFLKIHGETIRRQPILQVKARKLLEVQSAVWQKLDKLFQSNRCMFTLHSNLPVI